MIMTLLYLWWGLEKHRLYREFYSLDTQKSLTIAREKMLRVKWSTLPWISEKIRYLICEKVPKVYLLLLSLEGLLLQTCNKILVISRSTRAPQAISNMENKLHSPKLQFCQTKWCIHLEKKRKQGNYFRVSLH